MRKWCISENISPVSKSWHSKQESRNLKLTACWTVSKSWTFIIWSRIFKQGSRSLAVSQIYHSIPLTHSRLVFVWIFSSHISLIRQHGILLYLLSIHVYYNHLLLSNNLVHFFLWNHSTAHSILSISPTCNFLFLQYLFTAKKNIIIIVPQTCALLNFFISFVTAVKSYHEPAISKTLT